jgi:lipoate---protein ligase
MNLLRLKSYPIYEQLLLEEMLLRSDTGNWCLINEGSTPAIVMGISGKKEELVDCAMAAQQGIPLIKRFSGGGTVIVDEDTLFVTFICQKHLHDFSAYPEPILRWTEALYREALQHPEFRLRENDYAISDRKFGGNAQYIKKDRWLHHTSFLWDYSSEKMQYLLHPKKMPAYREGRSHEEFLCRLSEYFSDKEEVIDRIVGAIEKRFSIQRISLEEALAKRSEPVRLSTHFIPLDQAQLL